MNNYFKKIPLLIFFAAVVFFYSPLLSNNFPIPTDTIVGIYHPFRDFYSEQFPRGVPFQNFLITDPVRQTFIWKDLAIDNLSKFNLPLWNPYEMTGKPLMGNLQSSPFYPLNIILFIKPFSISWSIFIFLQTILAGLFTFFYLKNLKLRNVSAVVGSFAFALGGFSVAWLEWGNIVHTGLWLPLMLLSIDRIVSNSRYQVLRIKNIWLIVFILSLSSSFLAGHLQTFFYISLTSAFYFIFKLLGQKQKIKKIIPFAAGLIGFIVLTFIQWYQTFIFILNSARISDRNYQEVEGWFVPLQNLVQFIAPDYFGNPATGNYWGVWNYAEFVGYVGIAPLILAVLAILLIRRKIIYFFAGVVIVSLIFMTENFVSVLPFTLEIPFISTAQPTRIIFLICFSLSVLSAFGLNYILSKKINLKKIILLFVIFMLILGSVWITTFVNIFGIEEVNKNVSLRNLILPTALFGTSLVLLSGLIVFKKKLFKNLILIFLLLLISFDLVRFAGKFNTFATSDYLFTDTKITKFLEEESKDNVFRIATLDNEIMAPNFSTYYRVQSVSGYDPLYLSNYAEFVAALERGEPNIKKPYGFNRIINPNNFNSPLFDLLNVKYLLSLNEINDENYDLVMEEGKTKLYEYQNLTPRAFFVENVTIENNEQKNIEELYQANLREETIVMTEEDITEQYSKGEVIIESYNENEIEITTSNSEKGFLVITDVFYPSWEAKIDGEVVEIYRTNYAFRGIVVPKGKHEILLEMKIF